MNIKRSCPFWTEKPRDTDTPRYNDHFIIQNCGICVEYRQETPDRCNSFDKLLEYIRMNDDGNKEKARNKREGEREFKKTP